jgi:methionine synthase / methylenetetrahydrofolate reductase(NADPH)
VPPVDELRRDWGDQTSVLAEAGADLILIETMSAIFQLLPAIDAARTTGLPVFLGIHATPEGTLSSGETLEELVAELENREPDAILLMCRPPEHISAMLPALRAAFSGAIGGYANVGYEKDPDPTRHQYHSVDQGYRTPVSYAEFCQEWLEMGAQIVGGCCGTTPEHIAAIRPFVNAELRATVEGTR